MKIKTIEALCKARGTIYLADAEGVQWISDGVAVYPLYGMPQLDESNIFTMFDIPDEKRGKYMFDDSGRIAHTMNLADNTDGERQVQQSDILLQSGGYILMPIKTSKGIVYINKKYLAPFADSENGVMLYERIAPDGTVYIAVKTGFFLSGVISPVNIMNKSFADELLEIATLTAAELKKESADEEQLAFPTE